MRMTLIALLLATSAHAGDEPLQAYGDPDKTWVLQSIDGSPFPARTTLTFPEPGRIAGEAPCNAYRAEMTAEYPGFETGPIAATHRACPDLDAEMAFFTALATMRLSEVQDDALVLSTEEGGEMVFTSGE